MGPGCGVQCRYKCKSRINPEVRQKILKSSGLYETTGEKRSIMQEIFLVKMLNRRSLNQILEEVIATITNGTLRMFSPC